MPANDHKVFIKGKCLHETQLCCQLTQNALTKAVLLDLQVLFTALLTSAYCMHGVLNVE